VQIGLTDGDHIEIVSGVKAGEMIIVDGQAGLPDGAAIRVDTGAASDVKPTADAADKGEK